MNEIITNVANYGISIVIVGLFLWDWVSNKKKISETLEEMKVSNINTSKSLEEMKVSNSNTAKSLELLQRSMDNQTQTLQDIKQNIERMRE